MIEADLFSTFMAIFPKKHIVSPSMASRGVNKNLGVTNYVRRRRHFLKDKQKKSETSGTQSFFYLLCNKMKKKFRFLWTKIPLWTLRWIQLNTGEWLHTIYFNISLCLRLKVILVWWHVTTASHESVMNLHFIEEKEHRGEFWHHKKLLLCMKERFRLKSLKISCF